MIAHERHGAGEPLVLVHGLGGTGFNWQPVVEPLSRHHEVIVVDLPGFGRTPPLPPDDRPTAQRLARSVGELLDGLGHGDAHLAGNSLGGWIALEAALQGRARTVTAICPAGFWRRPLGPRPGRLTARHVGGALRPLIPLIMRNENARRTVLSMNFAHPERLSPEDASRLAEGYLTAPGFDAANLEMRSSRFDGGERIDVPVTVAWGEHDRLLRPNPSVVPQAEHVVMRGCGHTPMWDDPQQSVEVILATTARAAAVGA